MMAMVPIWPYAKWFKDNRWQGLWMKGGGQIIDCLEHVRCCNYCFDIPSLL
jgi:hypothetical protein